MPTFQYLASSAKGENVRGSIPAADKSDLAKKLKEKGLFLVSSKIDEAALKAEAEAASRAMSKEQRAHGLGTKVEKSSTPGGGTSLSSPNWWKDIIGRKAAAEQVQGEPGGKVALKELVVFTRQISISINAGMSFVDALQGIQTHAKNPKLAYVLRHVLDDILSGKKLSEALGAHPDVFKAIYVNMVMAGEAGGFVPEALNRIAEFLEKEIELRGKIKSAMVYPVVIGVVAFCVVTFMMIFIVPIFVQVFKEMNAPLPAPTRALVAFSNFMRHGGFLAPFVFLGIFLYAQRLRKKSEKFRSYWDERVLLVPLFGKLAVLSIITRFIRTLATLVDNGVMALQAISMARQVVENRSIEAVVDEIYSSVQQGNGISPVLYKSKYFPVLVANMVSTGEKTGELPTVLTKMADYYDSEVSAAVRDLLAMMEPLLIVVMAIVVGFIIAGLMMPTFQMSNLVQ